ncbi:MAG: DUF493 domain-containing protein [Succinivibrio sp.]|nr:DUF493 domain-containing protein [Succinivibrio sp.]
MPDVYSRLQKLLDFPSLVDFRIIVDAKVLNALDEVKNCISSIEPDGLKPITKAGTPSRNGNYISYTVPVTVSSAQKLETLYTEIAKMPCVMHIL